MEVSPSNSQQCLEQVSVSPTSSVSTSSSAWQSQSQYLPPITLQTTLVPFADLTTSTTTETRCMPNVPFTRYQQLSMSNT